MTCDCFVGEAIFCSVSRSVVTPMPGSLARSHYMTKSYARGGTLHAFDTHFLLPLTLCLQHESSGHWKRWTRARVGMEVAAVPARFENLLLAWQRWDRARRRMRSCRPEESGIAGRSCEPA